MFLPMETVLLFVASVVAVLLGLIYRRLGKIIMLINIPRTAEGIASGRISPENAVHSLRMGL